ncbi:hypothetical protein [Miltoncostaea marina]|uniref:hypothetical protein n=1 Tax=Miltoncostaea marina TaxID=2843215 RepID=UPI001C3DA390|nr:hypothetical protein [Miltoncostaea marina]
MARRRPVRSLLLATALAAALLATLPAAALGAWAKVSGDAVSTIHQPSLLQHGPRVLALWPAGTGTDLATTLELRGFAPTLARPGNGLGAVATVASGFTVMASQPALLATPAGPRAVYGATRPDGIARLYLSEPFAEGVAPAGPPAELGASRGGTLDAVALADGTPVTALDWAGDLHVQRGAIPVDQEGAPLQAQLGGCCSYNVAAVLDAAGGVWVAWYSNAAGQTGVYVQAVDPATGAPLGSPAKAPQSQGVANNTQRIALVAEPAGPGARVVYAAQSGPVAPYRIVSWRPGEGAPTPVAVPGDIGIAFYGTAARHRDGRLWVAWYDREAGGANRPGVVAKLGNARGAGGVNVPLGQPPRTVANGPLASLAQGENLLVGAVMDTGAVRGALWATVSPEVIIQNPQTIRSGPARVVAPKRVSIRALRASRTKCVHVKVTAVRAARVQVSIFSGRRSIRLFGQARVVFPTAGSKVVCVRVPLRARTFDVRTPTRIAVAAKPGARPVRGEKPATLTIRGLRFFR